MSNCSFCGKSSAQVFRVISSDGCRICNECIGRCCDILAEEYSKTSDALKAAHDVHFPENGEPQA